MVLVLLCHNLDVVLVDGHCDMCLLFTLVFLMNFLLAFQSRLITLASTPSDSTASFNCLWYVGSPDPRGQETGFDPSWISLFHLGIFSGTSLRTRRLVHIFYGKLRPAGAQTVWLLHFMLQMYATQKKTSILNNNHPTKNNTMVEPVAATAAWLW